MVKCRVLCPCIVQIISIKVKYSGYEIRAIAFSPDNSKVAASVWRREPVDITQLEVFSASHLNLIWSSKTDVELLPSDLDFSPNSAYLLYTTGTGSTQNLAIVQFNDGAPTEITPPFPSSTPIFFAGWL
jgi:hypothetical protein